MTQHDMGNLWMWEYHLDTNILVDRLDLDMMFPPSSRNLWYKLYNPPLGKGWSNWYTFPLDKGTELLILYLLGSNGLSHIPLVGSVHPPLELGRQTALGIYHTGLLMSDSCSWCMSLQGIHIQLVQQHSCPQGNSSQVNKQNLAL